MNNKLLESTFIWQKNSPIASVDDMYQNSKMGDCFGYFYYFGSHKSFWLEEAYPFIFQSYVICF